MTATADHLAFRARALAQSHPLTPLANRYVTWAVGVERALQTDAQAADWAGAELVVGYCLRRVEESDAGLEHQPEPGHTVTPDQLEPAAQQIAAALRVGDPEPFLLAEPDDLFTALNAIIASEVDNRTQNFRDEMDAAACDEFADFVTAWVVTGYAVRVAERQLGALR